MRADRWKSAVEDYLKAHLVILAWNAFLLFGGLIFLLYFARIGYLPELNLKDSVFFLAVAAVTGFFFVTSMSAGLVFPSIIWSSLVENKAFRALWPRDLRRRLSRAVLFLGLPLATVGVVFALSVHTREKDWYVFTLGSIPLVSLIGFSIAWLFFYVRRRKVIRRAGRVHVREPGWKSALVSLRQSLTYWVVYLLSCVFFLVPFVIIYLIARRFVVEDPWVRVVVLALLPAFVIFVNVMGAIVPKGKNQVFWRALLGVVTLFSLLVLCEATVSVSATVMRLYGIGNIRGATLVVGKDGCSALEQVGVQPILKVNDTCKAEGVTILSRLGNSYYLRWADPQGNAVLFTVPSSSVLSWGWRPAGRTPQPQPNQ